MTKPEIFLQAGQEFFALAGIRDCFLNNRWTLFTYEVKLYIKLYKITKNDTLKKFRQILMPVFTYIYEGNLINKPVRKITNVSHKGLADVLRNETPEKIRIAMRKHLENHFQRLYQY